MTAASWLIGASSAPALYAQPLRANALALMNFTNSTLVNAADYAPLEWSVPELIATRLARNPSLDIVDRRRVTALLEEQNLGASDRVDSETASRIGRIVGARYMLFGTVLLDRRNRLRIDARVLDVETSRIVHSETFRDADWNEDVSYVVDSLAERLSRNLRLPGRIIPRTAPSTRSTALPTAPAEPQGGPTSSAGVSPRPDGPVAQAPVATSMSVGLVTMGRAIRLQSSGVAKDKAQAVAMMKTAATQTPSLARDIEDILKRWEP